MAIVTLVSGTGSPGVTTTALGLSLWWPRDVVLVDADPFAAHTVEAGFLRGAAMGAEGLSRVARAHRERRDLTAELWGCLIPLTTETSLARRFLPGFAAPGGAEIFAPVWPDLAGALASLEAAGFDVVVDAGRAAAQVPAPLLRESSTVALVCQSSLRSLAAVGQHLGALTDRIDSVAPGARVGLVVVGPGRPYSSSEIAAQFKTPVIAEIAWDARGAQVLSDGFAEPRYFERSALTRSWHAAASSLSAGLRTSIDLVASR